MINKFSALALAGLAAAFAFAPSAQAAECATTIEGNDAMQFSTKSLSVPASCKEYKVTLKHTGQLAANIMGHNVVVTKTADMAGVNGDGMKAGADNNYVKPGDSRVIANSKVIGGGESTTFSIPVAKLAAGEDYSFFCSFPGHFSIMQGKLTLAK